MTQQDATPPDFRCSVVIPAYNAASTLAQCLGALLEQRLSKGRFEIIVVDDGSTDATAELARRFDVRLVQQPNQGPAAARNHGAREARGEIVVFTDSDCVAAPGFLEALLTPFDDPHISGAQGAYLTRQHALVAQFAQVEFEDRYQLMASHQSIDLVATYAAAFRRQVFLEMGGFDESFPVANNEDTEFSYRLCDAGHTLVFAPEAQIFHLHPHTLSKYLRTKYWRAFWRIIVYRKYPEKAVKDRYTSKPVKLQTLFMLTSFPCLLLGVFWTPAFWPALLLWLGVMVSGASLTTRAWRRSRDLGLATPLIILARAAVFAAGSLHGLLACLLQRRTRNP